MTKKTHELESFPEYFEPTLSGVKKHELRYEGPEQVYNVGDDLVLIEVDPETKVPTGRKMLVEVTFISHRGKPWLKEGQVLMSIKRKRRWNFLGAD